MGGYTPPLPEGRVQEAVSEDCLSVSVTRPKVMYGPLPVLVYIYGGAWLMGADCECAERGVLLYQPSHRLASPARPQAPRVALHRAR
jgi:carboxylesterase type B